MDVATPNGQGPRKAAEIFAATLALVTDKGYDGLTVEAVAARAGVNKTTLYRWWPSKDALLAAALVRSPLLAFTLPDTGSLRGDLRALAEGIVGLLTGPDSAAVIGPVLAAAPRRPELAELGRAFFADRLARERPIFDRAVERGELAAGTDPETVMDLLAGAIWLRLLLRGRELGAGDLERILDTLLHGALAARG
ncbi:TetR/AcrR family transcriptional regulator [Nocardia thailandica]|uniref:TetR/AcrR family transcriptional regulator n=1 Tax=Nocardia thailandica TaxID=257275 RepID=A0ABW6PRR1_9NOCA